MSGTVCKQCGGTGLIWLARSAFTADGHRRAQCGLCGGTGRFRGHGNSAFALDQRHLREYYRRASRGKGDE